MNIFRNNQNIAAVITLSFLFFSTVCYVGHYFVYIKPYYWSISNELNKVSHRGSIESIVSAVRDGIVIAQSMHPNNIPGTVSLYGGIQKIIDKKVDGNIVRLNNGYLSFHEPIRNLDKSIEKTIQLKNLLEKKNIPLLYVQAPFKIHHRDKQLPRGFKEYSEDNVTRFLTSIEKNGVSTFDTRTLFEYAPEKHYSLFLKSDHHWQPSYAFFAWISVTELLREKYGYEYSSNLAGSNHYQEEDFPLNKAQHMYPNMRLGSMTRLVGASAPEDILQIKIPQFKTDSSFYVPKEKIHISGNCKQTWFLEGNYDITLNVNNQSENDTTILLISDSFGCFFANYLSLSCKKLIKYDPRACDIPLETIIQQYKPNYVIVLFNPDCLHQISWLKVNNSQ